MNSCRGPVRGGAPRRGAPRAKKGEALPPKAYWARYTRADEVLALLTAYAVGLQRVAHLADTGPDPLLPVGLALERFPHVATLYRALGRFDSEAQVEALQRPHQDVVAWLLRGRKQVILDLDGTVETVFGHQEGACIGYNPRYKGRPSYFPMIGFDGITRTALGTRLRGGKVPSSAVWIDFYRFCRAQLPPGVTVATVRVDLGAFRGTCWTSWKTTGCSMPPSSARPSRSNSALYEGV